ncbi:hypothetical protein H6CHR_02865 [Variovorax sp. PBL-H6]|uniref:hypothetical protein n=1 Tax=Variovorax sp. PBL-H6 TaxID=434009 RepID=UPI001316EBF5|nr:hypothetical protein [Variovorax sp. PBL-H6]VTU27789.1 hypothetical protein H6CHR_02865 [Variovorax sp. PBL-H6]
MFLTKKSPSGTPLPTQLKLNASTHAPSLPDSGLLDSWATQGATQNACTARKELVRLLDSAARHPSSELNLGHCDAQACLELSDHLVDGHAEACTRADPSTIRLILPSGLVRMPGWIIKFTALRQLIAHGFTGDSDAALNLLEKQCPDLMCDLSSPQGSAKPPETVDIESRQKVHAALAENMLRPLERPFIGTLDPDAKAGLQHFVSLVRETLGTRIDLAGGSGYNLGGFKILRRQGGELGLSKLAEPPHIDGSLDPRSAEAEDLPRTIEIFNAHSEDLRVAIWQAMTKCGYVKYLQAHAATLIDGEWDILVNVGLYFSRNLTQNGAHKDTEGENLFVLLLYCNDQHIEGMEYIPGLANPPEHQAFIERQLPSVFVDEVAEILQTPPHGTAYAPQVEPWGFIGGCDELMVHSTPFVHHRGAFVLVSVIAGMGPALQLCFGPRTEKEYSRVRQCYARGESPSTRNSLVLGAHKAAVQLEELALSDDWIDRSKLEELLRDAGLAEADAAMLFKALAMKATTEDPFDGTALIDIPHLRYSVRMTVPRGKELRREMSEKLENGTVRPQPATRDMARVWVMARRKPT